VSRRIVIAYWLIPAEPARSFFQGLINELAQQYDAPMFEPHVTVFVGGNSIGAAHRALSQVALEAEPTNMKTLGIDQSDEFIKTLFVQFAPNRPLRRINETIRDAAKDSSRYDLKPHLSLLYKTMPAATRRDLAGSIGVPYSDVSFDAIKAVRCASPTQTRADVEAWHILASGKLSE
jgi:2'-5' RNA ligase